MHRSVSWRTVWGSASRGGILRARRIGGGRGWSAAWSALRGVRINSDDVAQEFYISENASLSSCWRGVRCDWPRSASAQAGCSAVPARSSPVPSAPGGDGESMRTLAVKMYRPVLMQKGRFLNERDVAGTTCRPGAGSHGRGKEHAETGATPRPVIDLDPTAMRQDDGLATGQSQSVTGHV